MEHQKRRGRFGLRQYAGLTAISGGARSVADMLTAFDRENSERIQTWFSNFGNRKKSFDPGQAAWRATVRIVYDLEKQGFIIRKPGALFLTDKGRAKLRILRDRFSKAFFDKTYPTQKSDELVIVSFDIPERERVARNWLRAALERMGLTRYHQSLWMGNLQLSEDFLQDLVLKDLQKYIAIFTVGKKGTLKPLL